MESLFVKFALRKNQKNMNYSDLWNTTFKDLGGRCCEDIQLWCKETVEHALPFTLYILPGKKVPSAASLGLRGGCGRQLPVSRVFDDNVLITISFRMGDTSLFCAYTTSLCKHLIFCLWERRKLEGIQELLPSAVFDGMSLPSGVCTDAEIVSLATAAFDGMSLPSGVCTDAEIVSLATVKKTRTIDRSACIYHSQTEYDRVVHDDDEEWEQLKNKFSAMNDEFDGIAECIVQQMDHSEYKGAYLKLKSIWTEKVEEALQDNIPLDVSSQMRTAIWLYISGCPGIITSPQHLSVKISRIIQSFESDKINYDDFVKVMEENGYRRPFSRLVGLYLSTDWAEIEFFEVMRGLCTCLSLNSFLCTHGNEVVAYYRSYIKDTDGITSTDPPTQCILSVAETAGIRRPLIAKVFEPSDEKWYPIDFARHTYNIILNSLKKSRERVILGHVTAEQSVINMCRTGMSIYATHTNSSTCGSGMYFFKISEAGDFDVLCRGGGNSNAAVEFQSFLYALTRAFQLANTCHHLSPAVLLFEVDKTFAKELFMDATANILPLLCDDGGCSCPRRYDNTFTVNIDKKLSIHDIAAALKASVEETTKPLEIPERINALALRFGVVNFACVHGFASYVSDGSKARLFDIDFPTSIQKAEKTITEYYPGSQGDSEILIRFCPQTLCKTLGLNEKIELWRRKPLGFSGPGNFHFVEPISMNETRPSHWQYQEEQCHPWEWVITSQQRLGCMLENTINSVDVVFVASSKTFLERPKTDSSFEKQEDKSFDRTDAYIKSDHCYFKGLRRCDKSCRSI